MVSNINYIFFVYFFRGLVQQVIKNLFSEHYIHVTIVYLHPCPHQVISASFERERERGSLVMGYFSNYSFSQAQIARLRLKWLQWSDLVGCVYPVLLFVIFPPTLELQYFVPWFEPNNRVQILFAHLHH